LSIGRGFAELCRARVTLLDSGFPKPGGYAEVNLGSRPKRQVIAVLMPSLFGSSDEYHRIFVFERADSVRGEQVDLVALATPGT
jgi:hypothetical protein